MRGGGNNVDMAGKRPKWRTYGKARRHAVVEEAEWRAGGGGLTGAGPYVISSRQLPLLLCMHWNLWQSLRWPWRVEVLAGATEPGLELVDCEGVDRALL
jgi:hypothetical protein